MRAERESNQCLVQAIPQSHHIRPIVQIKQSQAMIEDTKYLSKRKSDNHLGASRVSKYKLDAVRRDKSYSQYTTAPAAGPVPMT